MNVKQSTNWYFPPTTNRKGDAKNQYDIKTVMIIESDLFDEPVIAMSDIHGQTPELVVILDEFVNLNQFVVLTAGDMSGDNTRGTDGIPTPEYQFLADRAKEFYFVQGNHDLPDKQNKQDTLKNKQDKRAGIRDGTVVNSLIGSIGGVNGIVSNKPHPYKMSWGKYHKLLIQALGKRPNILMTHDTPSIDKCYNNSTDRYVGSVEIFDIVSRYKPKIHFYGHCHHPTFHNLINGVNYINIDARVLIFVKPGVNMDGLFKKPLEERFSPSTQNNENEYDII